MLLSPTRLLSQASGRGKEIIVPSLDESEATLPRTSYGIVFFHWLQASQLAQMLPLHGVSAFAQKIMSSVCAQCWPHDAKELLHAKNFMHQIFGYETFGPRADAQYR